MRTLGPSSAVFLVGLVSAQAPVDPFAHYRAQMVAAEYALRLGEQPEAEAWLRATDASMRGVEWRLRTAALDDSLACFARVEGVATSLDASPDGTLLAVGTNQGTIELRRTDDGEIVRQRKAHDAEIAQIRFDRTGKRLVAAGHDRKVRVLAVDDLRTLVEFSGHGFPVGGAAFTPDGTQIASVSYERPDGGVVGTLHVFGAEDGSIVRTMPGGRKPLTNLAISSDGAFVAAASWDFCLFVWPLAGGEAVKLPIPDEGVYNGCDGVAFRPDGKQVAAAVRDHTARVFDPSTGALLATLRGHGDSVAKVRYSPDGTWLATASRDGTLALWNTTTFARAATLRGHGDDVVDLCFSPDGRTLWSTSHDKTLRRFVVDPSVYGDPGMRATRAAYVARFDPEGRRIATCSYDGRIQIWCADTLTQLGSFAAHPEDKSCHALEWSPDGAQLLSCSWEPVLKVHDAVTFAEVARYEHSEGFGWARLSPDGTRIAACSGKKVLVIDRPTMALVHAFEGHSSSVQTATWSRDGTRLVSCGRDGKAIVFEAATGAVVATISMPRPDVAEAAFVQRDSQVIVADRSGLVRLHDANDGRELRVLHRHRNGFDHFEASPDGQRLAIASRGLTLLDVEHGGDVATFSPHSDHPYHVAWDPRGERLASVSTDASVAVLDVRPLRDRLAAREAALAARTDVGRALAARVAAGESLTAIVESVRKDPELGPATRAAWIAALTLHSADAAR